MTSRERQNDELANKLRSSQRFLMVNVTTKKHMNKTCPTNKAISHCDCDSLVDDEMGSNVLSEDAREMS